MRKRKRPARTPRRKRLLSGKLARAGRRSLRSEKIDALPIINHFLKRLRLEEFLQEHLPEEDKRVKVPAAKALLVLVRNRYVKEVSTRFDLSYQVDHGRIAEEQRCDGVFPLVSNVLDHSELEVLLAYKHQPVIEKRFSQLKTDFRVAPVHLKEVSRIQALLCVYFLVLLVEALLERELRQAIEREEIESLPMYPEDRPCRRPTARRLIDLFEDIQRHTLARRGQAPIVFFTELSPLQRRILKLLGVPLTEYQA